MEKLYTQRELMEQIGISKKELQVIEDNFGIQAAVATNQRRYYTENSISEISSIVALRNQGILDDEIAYALSIQDSGDIAIVYNEQYSSDEDDSQPVESFFDIGSEDFINSDGIMLAESVGMQIEEIQVSSSSLQSILDAIALLRLDVNSLLASSIDQEREALKEENERLKAKVKEKTYEAVELREQIKQLNGKGQKKSFFKL
ncbi:MAG: MerR family transcriptional regulator [Eubacteriaceae bacterium]|jgi:DNA-binding transcriptional MerR regulator|nr:MerR family transcriptional regulator [Eubacteriaceae bacterium]